MFQRIIRSRLDLLLPKKPGKGRKVGEVYCRDYKNTNKKQFVNCMVDEVLGQRTYLCRIIEENLVWKRHLDQILSSVSQDSCEKK